MLNEEVSKYHMRRGRLSYFTPRIRPKRAIQLVLGSESNCRYRVETFSKLKLNVQNMQFRDDFVFQNEFFLQSALAKRNQRENS